MLTALFLLGCNLGGVLESTPPPTATPILPLPTPTEPLPPTPVPLDEIAGYVLEQLTERGLVENDTAFIDALGRDIAERRIIDVYDTVSPSVVNITTQVLQRSFFFEVVPAEGAGSGFVLDAEGHIVTNYHVIRNARQTEVTFIDETTLPAEIVGRDPRNDIAILKVNGLPPDVQPVTLGDSASLRVGQRTIVIGNPFGQFGGTLTVGVVSALNRTIEGQDGRQINGIIQTDAAINSGNSGGPLLDSAGQVIGINSAIFSPSGTSAGVGFAIPVNTLKRVLPDLLALGRYRHPWLGIRYTYRVTPGLAEALDLPVSEGLLLAEIVENSPLAEVGARGAQQEVIIGNQRVFIGGDILTAINEEPIGSLDQLQLLLETGYQVGDVVGVTLIRGNEAQTIGVTLGEEPTQ